MGEWRTASRGRSSPECADDQNELAIRIPVCALAVRSAPPFGVTRPLVRVGARVGLAGVGRDRDVRGGVVPEGGGGEGAGFASRARGVRSSGWFVAGVEMAGSGGGMQDRQPSRSLP